MTDNIDDAAIPDGGSDLVKTTYPARGILWGIVFGLGLTLVLVTFSVITFDLIRMLITLIVGIGLGTVWSIFGPAKQPKG